MSVVLVVAPHPDDETLGCGGTLLRHKSRGDSLHWLIVTAMDSARFSAERIAHRAREIDQVAGAYGFGSTTCLQFPASRLDEVPCNELVAAIGVVVGKLQPEVIYLPFPGDAHTDHRAVYSAAAAVTKWFRYPFVKRVLACEIVSETDFGLAPDGLAFRPNSYVDISPWLDRKIDIMRLYAGEMGEHPFPRSERAIRALASLRGAQSGFAAAEAFMLLKEIVG
ncbi:MAG: PIG-L family deacetylase [Rhodocyclales bacterium]|nr:PIG-L family deacetylase [Rhodocyclales bacterium]